jgi:hypothetical protein
MKLRLVFGFEILYNGIAYYASVLSNDPRR